MEQFSQIVAACYEKGFSDLHIVGDHPLVCRRDGTVYFQKQYTFPVQHLDELIGKMLSERQLQRLRDHWSVDLALTLGDRRVRVNVFNSHRGVSMAVRFLPSTVPDLESLNLHPSLAELCTLPFGLVLICGSTGSGKTTTIAALIGAINKTRACHVVTLEDPIEYLFNSGQAFIEQRELGKHFHSYRDGLLDVLRQAPDVIVVGELRAPETIQLALDAAQSGHLVISTMHSSSNEETLHRLCNASVGFSQEHTRLQLSSCLEAIINQQLTFMPSLGFSVPHLSILRSSKALANVIRENKLSQIEGLMETSKDKGMYTFGRYREEFLRKKTHFKPPTRSLFAGQGAKQAQEYNSPLFDFGSHDPAEGAAACRADVDQPPFADTAPTRPAAAPGQADALIDSYIAQLESAAAPGK
jgi:twitching motility protein PilT